MARIIQRERSVIPACDIFSLKDHENKKFLTHFNERIEKVAKKLKVRVIPFQYGDALPIIKWLLAHIVTMMMIPWLKK